jgi:hypothetical protein
MLLMAELGLPGVRPVLSTERREVLSRRIRWFVAATITYNVIEAIVALTEGTRVSSTALIGFGLDSVIEVSSAAWTPKPARRSRCASSPSHSSG